MKNVTLGFHTNEEEMEWMMSDKGREAFVELTIRAINKVVLDHLITHCYSYYTFQKSLLLLLHPYILYMYQCTHYLCYSGE